MPLQQVIGELTIKTLGEGFTDLTPKIQEWVIRQNLCTGILHVNSQHTSCSLVINENADPDVLSDLTSYMKAIVPEIGLKPINGEEKFISYRHSNEGKDDMPAHIRTALTCSSLSLSISEKNINLGIWQAVYLWEHRQSNHLRKINLHAIGEIIKN